MTGSAKPPFLAFVECAGCGEMFSVHSPAAAANAKWCSERCRKRQYAGKCIDCGAPTDGSNGRGPRAAKRCQRCSLRRTAQISRDTWAAYRDRIEKLWGAGLTARQICAAIGRPYTVACTGVWRARGYDLPYRRSGEALANLRAANIGKFEHARSMRRTAA